MNKVSNIMMTILPAISLMLFANCSRADIQQQCVLDARGGRVLHIPDFDFSKPGLLWADGGEALHYEQDEDGVGCYRLVAATDKWQGSASSKNSIALLGNRNYIISVCLKADFERFYGEHVTCEVNMGLWVRDDAGDPVGQYTKGIMNKTDGWQRREREITTDPQTTHGFFRIEVYNFPQGGTLQIADIAIVELPPKEVRRYGKGEGAVFRGGPGNLDMKIEDARASSDRIEVRTTGALYTFDLASDTILARQMLERQRDICQWKSSLSLEGLQIITQTNKECVLANDNVTFGVQCDSLMIVVPHRELVLDCTSRIGGKWNRLAAGHLFVLDEYGGMTVNPDMSPGSGRLARTNTWVDLLGRNPTGSIDFTNLRGNQQFISSAKPGWRLSWYLSSGDRLGISIFPPRPYPWKQSFESVFSNAFYDTPIESYAEWSKYVDIVWLWNFAKRGWGMSYGPEYIIFDEELFTRHIKAVQQAGMKPIPYMSPWFYFSRDPDVFAAEVKRLRDKYGISGVYYDGTAIDNWVVAYEQMRLTRELFPDGTIVLHNTYPSPVLEPSIELPAITTYADVTYVGEAIFGEGKDWPYPKYMVSQYRKANCVGVMKQDRWTGLTLDQKDALLLKYNARACVMPLTWEGPLEVERLEQLKKTYFPAIEELKKLWQEKGDDPDFYEKYYVPKVEELTKDVLPK